MALSLTLDRAFNYGEMTIQLAAAFDEAKDWTVRSGGDVAQSLYGFGRG